MNHLRQLRKLMVAFLLCNWYSSGKFSSSSEEKGWSVRPCITTGTEVKEIVNIMTKVEWKIVCKKKKLVENDTKYRYLRRMSILRWQKIRIRSRKRKLEK